MSGEPETLTPPWAYYRRTGLSEMRPYVPKEPLATISVSAPDMDTITRALTEGRDPGGYVARNPKNHADQWYVAQAYFNENLEPLEEPVVARDEAAELRAENERLRQDRKPDYLYNPNDWEYTVPWRDRHLFDAEIEDADGVVRYRTAYDGPDVFAASVPVEFDDAGWPVRSEIQWFDSQEAAEEALLRVEAPEEQP